MGFYQGFHYFKSLIKALVLKQIIGGMMSLMEEFSFKFSTEEELERFMLILNLGIFTGLKNKAITIDEAQFYLYNPVEGENCKKSIAKSASINPKWEGYGLANIKDLVPQKMRFILDRLMNQTLRLLKVDEGTYRN